MDSAQKKMDELSEEIVGERVSLAILKYRRETLQEDVQAVERELRAASAELEELTTRAKATGARVVTERSIGEIVGEARVTDGHITALSDASEEAERMFGSYSKLYAELEGRAREVAESREKVLEEIKVRMETWRKYVGNLLDSVNARYEEILSELQAKGYVELTNGNDIEAAGLDLHVGFKGARPVMLDAYTQSGGERSTAVMAFLLALQHHIRSPFRAVDEYDVHMDPRNRESIFRVLVSTSDRSGEQYVMITPGQLTFIDESVHVITVQNVEGRSTVREMD
jgi:chromosome segregation protein